MPDKTIELQDKLAVECHQTLLMALSSVEKIISERNQNKLSTGKMAAVAREIKELIKVVGTHCY